MLPPALRTWIGISGEGGVSGGCGVSISGQALKEGEGNEGEGEAAARAAANAATMRSGVNVVVV